MVNKRLHSYLSRIVDIKQEEISISLLFVLYFFLLTASGYIIKPVKVSLFLTWLTPERLPLAYLLTALVIGFIVPLNIKLLQILKRQVYITVSLSFFIISLLFFWYFFQFQWPWLSMIYWTWSEIFLVTTITQYWILVNDIFLSRQAKRLVGFFISGGLLGGVCGAVTASVFAGFMGTKNLLLICPALLLVCLIIIHLISVLQKRSGISQAASHSGKEKQSFGFGKSFQLILKDSHLLLLSGIMMLAIIVTTFIDFQFNSVVEMTFSQQDSMTSFLGSFFTVLLVLSYLLHILVTNRILKNFGIRAALLIAPFFLLLGSLAIFFLPVGALIYWATLLKCGDKSLAHSLNQSVRELLYIPVSVEVKYRAKLFIDMFVNKFARGLAAIFLLLFVSLFHFSIPQISLVTFFFIIIWIMLNLKISGEYVNIVKKNIDRKWQDANKILDKVDVDLTKLVFDTLQSRERSSTLYAMHLLDLVKHEKLSPQLKKLINNKSDELRASSMASLLELDGESLFPELSEILEDEEFDAQIEEIMELNVYQDIMSTQIERIIREKGKETEISRMEAAKVIGMMKPTPRLFENLKILLGDESPDVVTYALESAGKWKDEDLLPYVIRSLDNIATQEAASRVLVDYKDKTFTFLQKHLKDPSADPVIRKSIPAVFARIGTQEAADLLSAALKEGPGDIDSEIIESLHLIRTKNPDILYAEKPITARIMFLINKNIQLIIQAHEAGECLTNKENKSELKRRFDLNLKHIFELLSLIYVHEDITKAYQNLIQGTPKSLNYSIDLLDNILKKGIKEQILLLIDDISEEERMKRCRKALK